MSTTAAVAYRYSSRALGQLHTHLSQCVAPNVLDLGPARAANVAYFSSFSGKIFVEDLRHELETNQRLQQLATKCPPDGSDKESDAQHSIIELSKLIPSLTAGVRFDLIACWDLLPYLPEFSQAQLLPQLEACLAPGGMMLILSADRKNLSAPKLYDIEDKEISIHETDSGSFARSNSPVDPAQALSLCELVSSVRLRNGFFELLFRRD